jgi:hypothetical protein
VCVLKSAVTSLSGVTVTPPPGAFPAGHAGGRGGDHRGGLDGLPAKLPARARALELFAGCGTISFALAQRIRVMAIEGDEALVTACHNAINQAGLMGKIEINGAIWRGSRFWRMSCPASRWLFSIRRMPGRRRKCRISPRRRVPTVIYVSCDPVSLGRDAAGAAWRGYRLEKVTPIDQFLWSARLGGGRGVSAWGSRGVLRVAGRVPARQWLRFRFGRNGVRGGKKNTELAHLTAAKLDRFRHDRGTARNGMERSPVARKRGRAPSVGPTSPPWPEWRQRIRRDEHHRGWRKSLWLRGSVVTLA